MNENTTNNISIIIMSIIGVCAGIIKKFLLLDILLVNFMRTLFLLHPQSFSSWNVTTKKNVC